MPQTAFRNASRAMVQPRVRRRILAPGANEPATVAAYPPPNTITLPAFGQPLNVGIAANSGLASAPGCGRWSWNQQTNNAGQTAWAVSDTWCTKFSSGYAVKAAALVFGNGLIGSGGEQTGLPAVTNIRAAIEYPILWGQSEAVAPGQQVVAGGNLYTCTTGGTTVTQPTGTGSSIADGSVVWAYAGPAPANRITPLTFSGQRTFPTLGNGQVQQTDVATLVIPIPAGVNFNVRVYATSVGSALPAIQVNQNSLANCGQSGDTLDHTTDPTAVFKTTNGGVTQGNPFTAMLAVGVPVSTRPPVISLVGDSICPMFLELAASNAGAVWVDLSYPGEQAGGFVNSSAGIGNPGYGAPVRKVLMTAADTVICEYGVNDNAGLAPPATLQWYITQIGYLARKAGCQFFITTLPPQTKSTDNFVTTTNQTDTVVSGNPIWPNRRTYNTWVRSVPYYATGYFDVAAAVCDPVATDCWKVDGSTQFLETIDGTHFSWRGSTTPTLHQGQDDAAGVVVDSRLAHRGPVLPPVPVAGFTTAGASGTAPLTVTFADNSTGIVTGYDVDFGDGSAHGATAPISHTYTTPGTYTVRYTVSNVAGASTVVATNYVTVLGPLPAVPMSSALHWYEAGRGGLYQDSGSTVAASSAGDPVWSAPDWGSLGTAAIVAGATAGNRPVLAASAPGGRTTFRGSGGKGLRAVAAGATAFTAFWIVGLFRRTSAGGTNDSFPDAGNTGTGTPLVQLRAGAANNSFTGFFRPDNAQYAFLPSTVAMDSTTGWLLLEATWDGTNLKRWHNGTQNGSTVTWAQGSISLTSWGLLVGALATDASYIAGDVAFFGVRGSAPSSAEQTSLYSYVTSNYPGVM